MSGFEVRNEAGVITINSDQRHTIVTSAGAPAIDTNTGDMNRSTPFGNLSVLSSLLTTSRPLPNTLTWFRLNSGAWAFPGAWYFQRGTVNFVTTSRVQNLASGFLDVYDESGSLIWSAASAGNMPRIQDLITITAMNTDQVYSYTLDYTPYILMGACPGAMDVDEVLAVQCGLLVKWTGTQLQLCWTNKSAKTFAQVFGGRGGLKIPLATFVGR